MDPQDIKNNANKHPERISSTSAGTVNGTPLTSGEIRFNDPTSIPTGSRSIDEIRKFLEGQRIQHTTQPVKFENIIPGKQVHTAPGANQLTKAEVVNIASKRTGQLEKAA